jgi:hypothetical protein
MIAMLETLGWAQLSINPHHERVAGFDIAAHDASAPAAPVSRLHPGASPLASVRDAIYLDHALMRRGVGRFSRQVLAVSAAHFASPVFLRDRSTSESILNVTAHVWRIERV